MKGNFDDAQFCEKIGGSILNRLCVVRQGIHVCTHVRIHVSDHEAYAHTVSDHFPIFTHLNLTPTPPPPPSEITFRRTKTINIIEFNNDVASSDLILHSTTSLPELLNSYDSTLRSILNKHALFITKISKPRKPNPSYTPALLVLKSARRHLERKYISTHYVQDYKIQRTATNQYRKLIAHAKRQFNAQLIQSSIPNPRLL